MPADYTCKSCKNKPLCAFCGHSEDRHDTGEHGLACNASRASYRSITGGRIFPKCHCPRFQPPPIILEAT